MTSRPRVKWQSVHIIGSETNLPIIDRLRILWHGTIGFKAEVKTQYTSGKVAAETSYFVNKIFGREPQPQIEPAETL